MDSFFLQLTLFADNVFSPSDSAIFDLLLNFKAYINDRICHFNLLILFSSSLMQNFGLCVVGYIWRAV